MRKVRVNVVNGLPMGPERGPSTPVSLLDTPFVRADILTLMTERGSRTGPVPRGQSCWPSPVSLLVNTVILSFPPVLHLSGRNLPFRRPCVTFLSGNDGVKQEFSARERE